MEDAIMSFFNLNVPCPKDILDCESLRERYVKDLQALERAPGCTSCKRNSLKSKFISEVHGAYLLHKHKQT